MGDVSTEYAEWREQLRQRAAASARRKAELAEERAQRRRRRGHGLVERQAARLARLRPDTAPFPPDPECTEW